MRILVTGGAGFIGSHLVDRLIEKGHHVLVIDNLSTGKKENLNQEAMFYEEDIRSRAISDIFKKEKPEIVFHLAAQINVRRSEEDPDEDTSVNVVGGLNILKAALGNQVEKFIFASSGGAIHGDAAILPALEIHPEVPLSVYGRNKLFFERLLEFHRIASNLAYMSLRFSNIYGPRQNFSNEAGVVGIFINALRSGRVPTIFGDGTQTRDYLYVDDAVSAALAVMEFQERYSKPLIFNVGTGKETSVNELFRLIAAQLGATADPIYGEPKQGEVRRSVLASHKIKEVIGFEPQYSLDEGLKKTIKWFQEHQ